MSTKRRGIIQTILRAGAFAIAIIAIATVVAGTWKLLGADVPAWASDIKRLDRQQTETAVDIYQRAVRGQLALPPPTDPVTKQNWEEELNDNKKKRDEAIQHRIELSK